MLTVVHFEASVRPPQHFEHALIPRKRLEDGRKSNAALATSVLQMIGPYNWVACQNCGHRNNSGTRCLQCGHSIEFDVME